MRDSWSYYIKKKNESWKSARTKNAQFTDLKTDSKTNEGGPDVADDISEFKTRKGWNQGTF